MDNNLNVLVEAKKELLNQLSSTILPSALDCMDSLYAESKVETQGRNTLKAFQEKLANIPKWNNYQIDTEVGKCVDRCGGCLDEMTAACFVATVKIISSVRLSKDSRKVSLKIPTNDVFVLGVYSNVAKRIYEDPYIYQEVISRNDRRKDLLKRMDGVVEETVKEMLPINQILKTYLNKNAVDVMNGEPVEPDNEEPESEMFPGSSELPVEEAEPSESFEEHEPSEEHEQPPIPMEEELVESPERELYPPQEQETKNFTFNDKIVKRGDPMPPSNMEENDDFSINPSARR
jgi:hypothetical protein